MKSTSKLEMPGRSDRGPQRQSTEAVRLELVECLYETAATAEPWQRPLCELSAAMGGAALVLAIDPATANDESAVAGAGIAPDFVRAYREQIQRDERWLPWAVALPSGAVINVSDLVTEREFIRTAFCADWLRPQRLMPSPVILGVIQARHNRPSATLAVFRPWGAGPVSDPAIALLRWLMPHLHRAVTIRQELFAARAPRREPAKQSLRERYRLTAAEARVAEQLAQGCSLVEVAAALGICINTVRVHLRHLFAKTGTNRQGALVHRMLSE